MVAELAALATLILAAGAEVLHAARSRGLARLAFGPAARPARWARLAGPLRALALSATVWGLTTLLLLPPASHRAATFATKEIRHLLILWDVSPSMRLEDAGPAGKQSRLSRAADVMRSFFDRIVLDRYRISVVAVYNGAKPVVVDTRDMDVVYNIFDELPLHYAFESGETKLFEGLEEAARLAHPWNPKSTTLILVSDGFTAPAAGMPKLPAAIDRVLVLGVGDPRVGRFLNGRQIRQETAMLRQIAARMRGEFHNANDKQVPSDLLRAMTQSAEPSPFERLTRREYALLACALGAALYAGLPLALYYAGTRWQPGVKTNTIAARREAAPSRDLVRVG